MSQDATGRASGGSRPVPPLNLLLTELNGRLGELAALTAALTERIGPLADMLGSLPREVASAVGSELHGALAAAEGVNATAGEIKAEAGRLLADLAGARDHLKGAEAASRTADGLLASLRLAGEELAERARSAATPFWERSLTAFLGAMLGGAVVGLAMLAMMAKGLK
jgi:hypothetical protein